MLKRAFVVAVLVPSLLFPNFLWAREEKASFSFNAFAFGRLVTVKERSLGFSLGHIWLINRVELGDFEGLLIIAPHGPPKALHNLQVSWKPSGTTWLRRITVGKTPPRFGWELWSHRVDMAPMADYSSLTRLLVARDWGAEAEILLGSKWNMTGGVFAGFRTGGNIPRGEGCCDLYLRAEYSPFGDLSFSVSHREGPVSATGLSAVWTRKMERFSVETVRTEIGGEMKTELSLIAERKLGSASILGRLERVENSYRMTAGMTVPLCRYSELKINKIWSKEGEPSPFIWQLAVRF